MGKHRIGGEGAQRIPGSAGLLTTAGGRNWSTQAAIGDIELHDLPTTRNLRLDEQASLQRWLRSVAWVRESLASSSLEDLLDFRRWLEQGCHDMQRGYIGDKTSILRDPGFMGRQYLIKELNAYIRYARSELGTATEAFCHCVERFRRGDRAIKATDFSEPANRIVYALAGGVPAWAPSDAVERTRSILIEAVESCRNLMVAGFKEFLDEQQEPGCVDRVPIGDALFRAASAYERNAQLWGISGHPGLGELKVRWEAHKQKLYMGELGRALSDGRDSGAITRAAHAMLAAERVQQLMGAEGNWLEAADMLARAIEAIQAQTPLPYQD